MNVETASWGFAEREIDRMDVPETRAALRRIDQLTDALRAACIALAEAEERCNNHELACDEDVVRAAFDTSHNDASPVLLEIQGRLANRAVGDGNRFMSNLRHEHPILDEIEV
jgi:hypothetical protein